MEINGVNSGNSTGAAGSQRSVSTAVPVTDRPEGHGKPESFSYVLDTETTNGLDKKAKQVLDKSDIEDIGKELNKFMESLNTDVRFSVYEKANALIVQVVDEKNGRVLKEAPPHEFYDMIMAIRDYVGALLDKKA